MIIYFLGKYSKFVRLFARKHGVDYWGIIRFISDYDTFNTNGKYSLTEKEFKSFLAKLKL